MMPVHLSTPYYTVSLALRRAQLAVRRDAEAAAEAVTESRALVGPERDRRRALACIKGAA